MQRKKTLIKGSMDWNILIGFDWIFGSSKNNDELKNTVNPIRRHEM